MAFFQIRVGKQPPITPIPCYQLFFAYYQPKWRNRALNEFLVRKFLVEHLVLLATCCVYDV
jgi:hypothetical protein